MSNTAKIKAELEGLLFVHGEPLKIKKAAGVIGVSEAMVSEASQKISEELKSDGRGLALIMTNDSLQLVTKPELSPLIKKFVQEEMVSELTPAALETIAVIAYSGPLSKEKIEHIRGVNSAFTLRSLLLKGLTSYQGGLYHPSPELLKHLGLAGVDGLPEYDKYKNLGQDES